MKKLLLLAILVVTIHIGYSQNNPYAKYGCKAPIVRTDAERMQETGTMVLLNPDTTHLIRKIQIYVVKHIVNAYDKNDSLLASYTVSPTEMLRWLTPDPKHQYHSPYLGMGNNWINNVDPDGAEVLDDIHLTSSGEYRVIKTSDPFDRFFFDGKYLGSILKDHWGGFGLGQVTDGKYSFKAVGTDIYWDPPANTSVIDPWKGPNIHTEPGSNMGWTLPYTGIHLGTSTYLNYTTWRMHEFGHYLQYSKLGVIRYMLEIAPMSGLNQAFGIGGPHDTFYTETDANIRAYNHFQPFYDTDIMNKFLEDHPIK